MGGIVLADQSELKLVAGLDDHSRYCVVAWLVERANTRAVCAAFTDPCAATACPLRC